MLVILSCFDRPILTLHVLVLLIPCIIFCYIGTTKLMITIWKERGLLSASQFANIQSKVDKFITPSDVGRIPYKISSGFSSFTADQLKNRTLSYFPTCSTLQLLVHFCPSMHAALFSCNISDSSFFL